MKFAINATERYPELSLEGESEIYADRFEVSFDEWVDHVIIANLFEWSQRRLMEIEETPIPRHREKSNSQP